MTHKRSRHREIGRKAQQIYNLVRADHDFEAERELRAYGPDAVAVANALIAEDYLRIRRVLSWLLALSLPVLLSVVLCGKLSIEVGVETGIIAFIVFAGFVLAWYIAGALFNVAIEGFHYQYRLKWNGTHAACRANKIACRVLTDPEISSSNVVGGLLMAAGKFSRHEPAERDSIDVALTRLLNDASSESVLALSGEQRDVLHYRFMTIADLVETVGRNETTRALSCCESSTDRSALLGVAILKAYEYLPVSPNFTSQFYRVRKIAAIEAANLPLEWQKLVAAAKHAIPIMQRAIQNSNGRNDLLRGSEFGTDSEKELLRVRNIIDERSEDELLRIHQRGSK